MNHTPVDVLIVGAGASGAAFAWSLSDTDLKILCIEQGDWQNQQQYPTTRLDWERHRFGRFSANPNIRQMPADYPVNDQDSPIAIANFNGVGGGTIKYMGHFPRLHASDFRMNTLEGVGDDWPLDYRTLEPFYDLNDRMTGVSGVPGNPAYPSPASPEKFVRLPPVPLGKIGRRLAGGFNELGWHWWPSDSAILTREFDGRKACVNAGPCDMGCATGSKASADIVYWPKAISQGVELKTRCRVREITIDNTGMASGVLYHDEEGRLQRQQAGIVVLACNGIGSPRLLLNSRSRLFPDGLANRSGQVGRNLMFHPLAGVSGIFDEPMEGFKGPLACCITSHEFYEGDPSRGFQRGYMLTSGRGFGPLTSVLGHDGTGAVPWGAAHRDFMDNVYDRMAHLCIISDDLPEECNRVTLDPELTDSDGIPAPKISYRQSENNKRMMAHGIARAKEVMLAAGAKSVVAGDGLVRQAGWHLLGTARMGDDPERSVVNSWGRCHDVKNLFVIDGSIFVTAGSVNSTSTIQALALYVADQIKKKHNHLFD